jgi:hypothetical protein
MEKIIKLSQDICCDKCGRYLFTENDVIKPGMSYTVTERENDKENYEYMETTGKFICDECLKDRGD